MSDSELLFRVDEGVGWITINREAKRNAITPEMIELFGTHLKQAETDESVRVICITGSGEKAFCSGADLAASFTKEDYVAGAKSYAALLKRLADYPKPLVGRVNGHCLAGGMGLLLSCDMAYARDGIKIGTPEVNVGLFPMMIGALIFRNAMRKKALEMIYTARLLQASEAEAMGLITRVVPAEDLDDVVNQVLKDVASKAPLALKIGRPALAAASEMNLNDGLDFLCEKLGEVVETEDAKEGLMAFMQKRPPEWKGR